MHLQRNQFKDGDILAAKDMNDIVNSLLDNATAANEVYQKLDAIDDQFEGLGGNNIPYENYGGMHTRTSISMEIDNIRTKSQNASTSIGDITQLATTSKGTIVDAINEIATKKAITFTEPEPGHVSISFI